MTKTIMMAGRVLSNKYFSRGSYVFSLSSLLFRQMAKRCYIEIFRHVPLCLCKCYTDIEFHFLLPDSYTDVEFHFPLQNSSRTHKAEDNLYISVWMFDLLSNARVVCISCPSKFLV
jgi:hypothetical protein